MEALCAGRRFATRLLVSGLVMAMVSGAPRGALGASFTQQDLRVLARAVTFMLPPLATDAFVVIAYAPQNSASLHDAEAIAAMIGNGLPAGKVTLRPKLVDVSTLGGTSFPIVIAADGANGPQLSAAAMAARALCVTTDVEAVRAGVCTMAIMSDPRVDIVLNHAASAAAGIEFVAAFRMMVHEIQ